MLLCYLLRSPELEVVGVSSRAISWSQLIPVRWFSVQLRAFRPIIFMCIYIYMCVIRLYYILYIHNYTYIILHVLLLLYIYILFYIYIILYIHCISMTIYYVYVYIHGPDTLLIKILGAQPGLVPRHLAAVGQGECFLCTDQWNGRGPRRRCSQTE